MTAGRRQLIVLGAGGHAKVVADVARLRGWEVVGFVDERDPTQGRTWFGARVIATVDQAPAAAVALGIGDNRSRLGRHRELRAAGREVVTLVHPSAVVADGLSLGAGAFLAAGVIVNSDAQVGAAVVLNTGCSVDHDCVLGDGVHVGPGSRLAGAVRLGEGAFVGIGSCVAPGLSVGAWAVCGAGAAVVRGVPPGVVVKGVPAR